MAAPSTLSQRSTPRRARRLILFSISTALVPLFAQSCAAAPPPPPSAPPPASSVILWARGGGYSAPEPPTADRLLLSLPANKPINGDSKALESGARATPSCLKATSFLPAPSGDPRIFFLVGWQLLVRLVKGEDPTPLSGSDPSLGITRLLACDTAASPLEILVAARPHGATEEEIWLLTVDERSIQAAAPLSQRRTFTDRTSFFARYNVPRCLAGGRRCLVFSTDNNGSYLDIKPTFDETEEPFQKLGSLAVLDAAWASSDGQSLYLLGPCL